MLRYILMEPQPKSWTPPDPSRMRASVCDLEPYNEAA